MYAYVRGETGTHIDAVDQAAEYAYTGRDMMNKALCCRAAAILLMYVSCKPDAGPYSYEYPPVVYTNTYSGDVSFKNAANEQFTLGPGASLTRNSSVPGRADIITVDPPYVTWKRNVDIYHIEFVEGEQFALEIRNYSTLALTLTEGNGYMAPPSQTVAAGQKTNTGFIYTDTPFFQLLNVSSPRIKYQYTGGKCIVGIDPPSGKWWEYEWP